MDHALVSQHMHCVTFKSVTVTVTTLLCCMELDIKRRRIGSLFLLKVSRRPRHQNKENRMDTPTRVAINEQFKSYLLYSAILAAAYLTWFRPATINGEFKSWFINGILWSAVLTWSIQFYYLIHHTGRWLHKCPREGCRWFSGGREGWPPCKVDYTV